MEEEKKKSLLCQVSRGMGLRDKEGIVPDKFQDERGQNLSPWKADQWNSLYPGSADLTKNDSRLFPFLKNKLNFFEEIFSAKSYDEFSEVRGFYDRCSPLVLAQSRVLTSYRVLNDNENISGRHIINLIRFLEGDTSVSLSSVGIGKYDEAPSEFSNPRLHGYYHCHVPWWDGSEREFIIKSSDDRGLLRSVSEVDGCVFYDQERFLGELRGRPTGYGIKFTGSWLIIKKEDGRNIYLMTCEHGSKERFTDSHIIKGIQRSEILLEEWRGFLRDKTDK